jgi:hypothetical protein
MIPEFKIGDTVTFKPYEKAIQARIVDVDIYNGMNIWQTEQDNRVFYRLGGETNSVCTGICIVESKLFEGQS